MALFQDGIYMTKHLLIYKLVLGIVRMPLSPSRA